jgi:aryl-alcohol dehydrogenase-like predicted oxidoreductase
MSDEMTYRHLGRSGLLVSRIGLGTMNFGYTVDEATSFAVMNAAIDVGINFFDTADVYGGPQSPDMKQGYGIAEETVGRWLRRNGRRDDIVLATKVYQPMGLGPNDRRLSAYHIRRACVASLRRLQTDHIDLYQMHHVDRATPWEEIWQAMEQLVREGKITYVGSSTSPRYRCSWMTRSWNGSTGSGRGRGKPRRRTPGEAEPDTCRPIGTCHARAEEAPYGAAAERDRVVRSDRSRVGSHARLR